MDVYLPNDFYQLRDDLPDWRDVSPPRDEHGDHAYARSREDSADPMWKVF